MISNVIQVMRKLQIIKEEFLNAVIVISDKLKNVIKCPYQKKTYKLKG